MIDILCVRTAQGFAPMGEDAEEECKRFKHGQQVWVSIRLSRNTLFHRKYLALVRHAFNMWSENMRPRTYKGMEVRPDFDNFRKELAILAGFSRATYTIAGDVRLEAESIAFDKMTQERFEHLYDATMHVILETILPTLELTEEEMNILVEETLRFG